MDKLFSTNVITVTKDSSVFETLQKMKFNSIKRVVVAEDGKPLGIITERDINKFLKNDKTARAINEIPARRLQPRK